jgi:hypothetical protein
VSKFSLLSQHFIYVLLAFDFFVASRYLIINIVRFFVKKKSNQDKSYVALATERQLIVDGLCVVGSRHYLDSDALIGTKMPMYLEPSLKIQVGATRFLGSMHPLLMVRRADEIAMDIRVARAGTAHFYADSFML